MKNIQYSLAYNKNIRIKTRTGKLGAEFTVWRTLQHMTIFHLADEALIIFLFQSSKWWCQLWKDKKENVESEHSYFLLHDIYLLHIITDVIQINATSKSWRTCFTSIMKWHYNDLNAVSNLILWGVKLNDVNLWCKLFVYCTECNFLWKAKMVFET